MKIEATNKETILRFPSSQNIDELMDIIDYFNFREIAQKSKATQKDVNRLTTLSKKCRFNRLKNRVSL